MISKVSKRKLPEREEKVFKPERKIESGIFDRGTLILLSKFIKQGIFDTLDFPIATGKEADVFRATSTAGYLAVKIYRIETSQFWNIEQYIQGDPRFREVPHRKRDLVYIWTRKEFNNLQICAEAGVRAPKPIAFKNNVLLMEFLGEEKSGLAYSTLREVGTENPESDLNLILEDIRKLYRKNLVHSDLSEYNIMMTDKGPFLIDFAQAVLREHPMGEEFLRRDIRNVLQYFTKHGIKKSEAEVLKWIKS